MASGPLTLYNAVNGLSTLVDAGDGIRQKSWLDEVSRWLKESVEPATLKGLGLGRLANFPTFLDGSGLSSNPIGQAPVISSFAGVEVSKVLPESVVFAVGDGAALLFGTQPLTQPDPTLANYGNTGSNGLNPPAPRGASSPAFVLGNAENYDLSLTNGILSIVVNGVRFDVNVGLGAATTSDSVVASIVDAGVPVHAFAQAGTTPILITPGVGVAQTIQVLRNAGDAGTVIFPAAAATMRRGSGSNLNQLDNGSVVLGVKPQRRVLPFSASFTATIGGVQVTMTDNGAGALVPSTGTHSGTISYTTGEVAITYTAAPTNATNINAKFKVLVPLVLSDPVRHAVNGAEFAIRLKP